MVSAALCGMIIHLTTAALADELSAFLRRCPCSVQRVGRTGLLVNAELEAEVRRRCYRCGNELEAPLGRLGSVRCLDCRAGLPEGQELVVRAELLELAVRRESAESQIRAYVRVWQALHPEADGNLRLVA